MMFSPISPSALSVPVTGSIDQEKTFISLTCTPSRLAQPGAKASISAMPSSSPEFGAPRRVDLLFHGGQRERPRLARVIGVFDRRIADVGAHLARDLGQAQGEGRRRDQDLRLHAQDVADMALAVGAAARDDPAAHAPRAEIARPEAGEITPVEGEIHGVARPDAVGPEAVGPGFAEPFGVVGRIGHGERQAGRARRLDMMLDQLHRQGQRVAIRRAVLLELDDVGLVGQRHAAA